MTVVRDRSVVPARQVAYTSKGPVMVSACAKLKISPVDVATAPRVAPILNRIGGIDDAVELIRASPTLEARYFINQYDTVGLTARERQVLPFEAYCVAANVCPSRMLEIVVATLAKHRALEGAVISALAHPQVVRTNAYQSMFPEGIEDRLAHLKMMGAMPLPKTAQTTIQVNASANSTADAKSLSATSGAPSPEDTIRKIVEARQQRLQLAAANATESIPAILPGDTRIPMTLDGEYEGADDDDGE